MSRAAYEIRTTGVVPAEMLEDFGGLTISTDPAGTTIHAVLTDEAELHGLLDALSREGLVLVDVRREPFGETGQASAVEESPPAGPASAG